MLKRSSFQNKFSTVSFISAIKTFNIKFLYLFFFIPVFRQGDTGKCWYAVMSGTLEVRITQPETDAKVCKFNYTSRVIARIKRMGEAIRFAHRAVKSGHFPLLLKIGKYKRFGVELRSIRVINDQINII